MAPKTGGSTSLTVSSAMAELDRTPRRHGAHSNNVRQRGKQVAGAVILGFSMKWAVRQWVGGGARAL